MLEGLAALLAGGEMQFDAFVATARTQGLRPEMWLKAKHAGLLTTELRDGVLYIRAIQNQAQGGSR